MFFGDKSATLNMGVSKNRGTLKMNGLKWKTLLKWMIWEYPYFRKHPYEQLTPPLPTHEQKLHSYSPLKRRRA